MTEASTTINEDYSTGVPRRHHSLYLEDGTFVMQVENAIFNVHRFFFGQIFHRPQRHA
ncbi:hypothetical protein M408DRAFT_105901 [Serendipita vermifera MAFF 305830]|uniref:BTB domain-containing protein n=1 Tax=Serendipita vermifera MAFF 305830 TaxID=933852 RepID=A0A0C2XKZ4_SERVB|nr:hypothetical protein M408DRAFT_105901 [Serendipita vermifera MAFF 305830]